MGNKIIIEDEVQEVKEVKPAEPSRLTKTVRKVADFDFNISNQWLLNQIPFALFIVCLLLLHIWNVHNNERIVRKTDKLNKEIKELRSEYISILSELMSESKQSTIAAKLDTIGIKELTTPPIKITDNSVKQ